MYEAVQSTDSGYATFPLGGAALRRGSSGSDASLHKGYVTSRRDAGCERRYVTPETYRMRCVNFVMCRIK